MFEFLAGLILGAVFSKFWLMIWNFLRQKITSLINKNKDDNSKKEE